MEVLGGLALALFIIGGCIWVSERVTAGARSRIPQHARQRGGKAVTGAKTAAGEPVRSIFARALADNWLENKRARRERGTTRPPASQTAGNLIRAAGKGTVRGARAAGQGVRNIRLPRTAVLLPGVTDQPKRPGLRSVPASPAQPQPGSAPPVPASDPAPKTSQQNTERPATMAPKYSIPPDFAAVIARLGQFEPESDGDLITFLRGIAAGVAGIAEAMEQHADHLLSGIGLDPAATQAITESAQTLTEAALAVGRAEQRFQQIYQGVRETAANGTVLPFRGRFITGESA